MLLRRGSPAPEFRTTDVRGRSLSLSDYRGKKLLLSFYRNAACALCNLQVHKIIGEYPTFRRHGLEVVAIFESPAENILKYVGPQRPPFPLVADPQARLYDLYGVQSSKEIVRSAAKSMNDGPLAQLISEAASIGYKLTKEPGSNFYRLPADFLIDGEGMVCSAYYTEVVGLHIPEEDIERFLGSSAGTIAS